MEDYTSSRANIPKILNSYKIAQNNSYGFNDPENVSEFLDILIPNQLQAETIDGMVISIVKDGEIFLSRGYGYSDIQNNITVNSNQTLFPVGSLSKVITAAAVMKLVEDGEVNLDVDINNYLSAFKIPATFKSPITLSHLLTHTAGFERVVSSFLNENPPEASTLGEFLISNLPKRVRPPGEVSSQSDYGYALIGYIIDQITGSFTDYINTKIFTPLGMNYSSFLQPLPDPLIPFLSSLQNAEDDYIIAPAIGSLKTSASDMSKFMCCLLNNGIYNGTQVLSNDSIQMILNPQFLWHENLSSNGISYGLHRFDALNQTIIGLGLSMSTRFNSPSNIVLFPDVDTGVFIAYNGQNADGSLDELAGGLLYRYFPYNYAANANITPITDFNNRVNHYVGQYILNQRVQGGYALQYEVTAVGGGLEIDQFPGLRFVEVEPFLFYEGSGTYDLKIAFGANKQGVITHMYASWFEPTMGFDKLHPFYNQADIQMLIITAFNVITLSSALVFLYLSVQGYWKDEKRIVKFSRLIIIPFYIIVQFFIISFNMKMNANFVAISDLATFFSEMALLIGLILIMIGILVVVTILAWWGKGNKNTPYWSIWGRIHFTILTLLGISLLFLFDYWILI